MNFILHIDTAMEKGSVCLSGNGQLLQIVSNNAQKEHASFIQPAIAAVLKKQNITAQELNAVSVVNGPGSYTGLRIGLATAKGMCYALQIPLITVGTFEVMTTAAIKLLKHRQEEIAATDLFCPMIDARRMEVYTALLNSRLQYISNPASIIISSDALIGQLNTCKIFFYGNGAEKFKQVCKHSNAKFINIDFDASAAISLSSQRFKEKNFAGLAYSEPFYGKEFYSASKV